MYRNFSVLVCLFIICFFGGCWVSLLGMIVACLLICLMFGFFVGSCLVCLIGMIYICLLSCFFCLFVFG